MRHSIGIVSIVAALVTSPVARAEDPISLAPFSNVKTPAMRIIESHEELAKKSGAKKQVAPRKKQGEESDAASLIEVEEHQAAPYRPCINARGWKNGRLVCADNGAYTPPQNSQEIEGRDPRLRGPTQWKAAPFKNATRIRARAIDRAGALLKEFDARGGDHKSKKAPEGPLKKRSAKPPKARPARLPARLIPAQNQIWCCAVSTYR
jgi:hypothetical protein